MYKKMLYLVIGLVIVSYVAYRVLDDKNPRDKTAERMEEKKIRDERLAEFLTLLEEQERLKESDSERLSEIEEVERMDGENHESDIPEDYVEYLLERQNEFESKLINSTTLQYVTSIGIDITSQEIQIGLNSFLVDSTNIDEIVDELGEMMPDDAPWHVVYSTPPVPLSCEHENC